MPPPQFRPTAVALVHQFLEQAAMMETLSFRTTSRRVYRACFFRRVLTLTFASCSSMHFWVIAPKRYRTDPRASSIRAAPVGRTKGRRSLQRCQQILGISSSHLKEPWPGRVDSIAARVLAVAPFFAVHLPCEPNPLATVRHVKKTTLARKSGLRCGTNPCTTPSLGFFFAKAEPALRTSG